MSSSSFSSGSERPLPGSIRAAIPHPSGGRIVMSGFPGLEIGIDGSAVFSPAGCRETLEGLRRLGAAQLTLLVEDAELDASLISGLAGGAQEAGITLKRFPITDYSVPSDAAAEIWTEEAEQRGRVLRKGGALAFACQHGAGRSGLMAAWSLIEHGMDPEVAIGVVRSHFSEAVESQEQEAWLHALR